ncbi:MAG: Gfo/Idh/MocA family oxidoreductase [Bacteroidales bacterium]|nr:Gfo/Idh/MocA family oxidoreductase [Bacteroidales bacterium]
MKEKISCALCSFGMSGRVFHGPLIKAHPGLILSAVLERSENKAIQFHPEIKTFRTYPELLKDPDIDLVVVNVPDHLHGLFCKQALEAGKHVIVEKPFTLTTSEGQKLLKLAEELHLGLFVFQNRRWDSDFLTIQKILNSEQLGKVVEYEAHYDRFRPDPPKGTWKEDEKLGPGLLYNLGAHLIDQALVLFGWPDSVYADIQKLREETKIVDYFNLTLYYPKLRVILRSSYLVKKDLAKFIIHGTKGSYIKSGSDPQEERLNNGWEADHPDIGIENINDWGTIYTLDNNSEGQIIESMPGNYLNFYDAVYEELIKNNQVAVSAEEGLNVIKIIDAAHESHLKGKIIVLSCTHTEAKTNS